MKPYANAKVTKQDAKKPITADPTFNNGSNTFDRSPPPRVGVACYGKYSGMDPDKNSRSWTGAYTDNNTRGNLSLTPYTVDGVDVYGNPKGADTRKRRGEVTQYEPAGRVDLPDTIYGMSDKLPRK